MELAFAFANAQVQVIREQAIFANQNARVDVWLPNNNPPQRGIELKCHTLNETKAHFQARVMDDVDKIVAGLNHNTATPCHLYTVAFTNAPGDLDFDQSPRVNKPTYYVQCNTQVMGNVYLIFARRNYP